jgi:hypothetical protein
MATTPKSAHASPTTLASRGVLWGTTGSSSSSTYAAPIQRRTATA